MRGIILLAAVACVVVTGSSAAQAADGNDVTCTKGIFWPFSRNPGDCLTDAEKRNGRTGVFGNPNPAAGAAAVAAPAQVAAAPAVRAGAPAGAPTPAGDGIRNLWGMFDPAGETCTKGWFWPFSRSPGDCLTDAEKRAGLSGAYGIPNTVAGAQAVVPGAPAPRAAAPAMVAVAPPVGTTEETCSKSWLWPFSRDPGDCLTDAEKRNGQTGVYGFTRSVPGAQVVALAPPPSSGGMFGLFGSGDNGNRGLLEDWSAPAVAAAQAPTPAASPTVIASLPSTPAAANAAAPQGQNNAAPNNLSGAGCNKGIFWPFSRNPGDCLTDAEKRNGQTGVYGDPTGRLGQPAQANLAPAQPPVSPAQANPAPIVAIAPTAPAAPIATQASAAVVTAPAQAAAVVQAPAAAAPAAPAANAEAACTKGIFWPFVRNPGDCPTDAERANAARDAGR